MIVSRERIQTAVARALLLDPEAGTQAAIAATAQALGLPIDLVEQAMEPQPA